MKKLLSLTLALALMFSLFAGCTKEEPVTTTAAPNTDKPTEAATTAAPEKVRTDIIIADTTDIKTLDPHAANDGYSARVFNNIYDALMKQYNIQLHDKGAIVENQPPPPPPPEQAQLDFG